MNEYICVNNTLIPLESALAEARLFNEHIMSDTYLLEEDTKDYKRYTNLEDPSTHIEETYVDGVLFSTLQSTSTESIFGGECFSIKFLTYADRSKL